MKKQIYAAVLCMFILTAALLSSCTADAVDTAGGPAETAAAAILRGKKSLEDSWDAYLSELYSYGLDNYHALIEQYGR